MNIKKIHEVLHMLVTHRSPEKPKRYSLVKTFLSTLLPMIGDSVENDGKQGNRYYELVHGIVGVLQSVRNDSTTAPVRFPSEALFQEFALALYTHSDRMLFEEYVFTLAAWFENKFTGGKHPFWAVFLDRAVLKPCNISSEKIVPLVFMPVESVVHALDDYIDTAHAAPSESMLDMGLTTLSLVLMPRLFQSAAGITGYEDIHDVSVNTFKSFTGAFQNTIQVPQVEDETPRMIREARGDFDREIDAAMYNINFRTKGTTGAFLSPLVSLLPEHAERITKVWDSLWLARATEMCAKDAVFDVEADILNRDHTPASAWAEDFGVGTPEWCKRIDVLFERYLTLFSASFLNHSVLPVDLVTEVKNKVHKNRFMTEALVSKKCINLPAGLTKLKKVYMIGSGKGGVGKSTVSWLIANKLRDSGRRVGVIDADIWGPSQDILFGGKSKVSFDGLDLVPCTEGGLTLVTLGQFVARSDAILLRSSMAANLIKRMALSVRWPEIEYMVIDLPPGASDIHIQLCSVFPEAEIILVTLAQPLALADTSRTVNIYKGLNKKIKGYVLNMTDITCSRCGEGNALGNPFVEGFKGLMPDEIPLLARLPFDNRLIRCHTGRLDGGRDGLEDAMSTLTRDLMS
ncbi:MAG: hypothetical protein E3K32_03470 [wastewater metagenome]|nr:hypothetical protein [Candidatus Loosdrechtia aerotolerans]